MAHNHNHPTTTDHSGHHHMPTSTPVNHDHHGEHGSSMDMGMTPYFHASHTAYVLFESCLVQSPGGMVGACIIIILLAVLYEGLKFMREVFLQRSIASKGQGSYTLDKIPSGSSQEQMVVETRQPSFVNRMLTSSHLLQTCLHMLQVFISYCLMLVFMSYNVWLCLAVVLGAGVGYFLFGWKRAMVVDSDEHCH